MQNISNCKEAIKHKNAFYDTLDLALSILVGDLQLKEVKCLQEKKWLESKAIE